jgi:STE24 endopeptidase
MGHEPGHCVMNHTHKGIAEFALVALAGFLFARWAMDRLLARYRSRLGLRRVSRQGLQAATSLEETPLDSNA